MFVNVSWFLQQLACGSAYLSKVYCNRVLHIPGPIPEYWLTEFVKVLPHFMQTRLTTRIISPLNSILTIPLGSSNFLPTIIRMDLWMLSYSTYPWSQGKGFLTIRSYIASLINVLHFFTFFNFLQWEAELNSYLIPITILP